MQKINRSRKNLCEILAKERRAHLPKAESIYFQ